MNRCKKKRIPWHGFTESFGQLSLNQTLVLAMYKKKIKDLQKNNKHLATALQQSRGLATDKENLLVDNGKILSIVNFSRVKLMEMAVNMKQATECLDETLLLLNSSLTDSLSKDSSINLNYRKDFKNKLKAIGKNSPIQEVSENSDKEVESNARKGKISCVDGCGSPPNKRSRLAKKEKTVRANCQDHRKSAEESSTVIPTICSKNANLNNSRICGSALNIKSLKRKKSFPKISNTESASSPKFSASSSKLFLQSKTKQKSLDNKQHKTAKVVLTDIAEVFLAQETENDPSPVSNGLPGSALNGTNVKCFTQTSPEDNVLIKKYFSSEPTSKQNSSSSNFNCSEVATNNNVKVPGYSQNIYNSSNISHKELSFGDISVIDKNPPPLFSKVNEHSVFAQNSNASTMELIGEDHITPEHSRGGCMKKTDSEKDKKSYKSQNLKPKRVNFYFDEDAIEKVEGSAATSKDRIRKSINKCKARKTVSHKKKSIPSENTVLKSSLILPDSISKLGKNSFLVTAEVHSPANGIDAQKVKSKICVSENMMPCVVLTDIFKSNRGLLSEMVRNSLQEKVCLQETVTESSVAPLAEVNTYTVDNNSSNDRKEAFVLYNDDTVGEDHFSEDRYIRRKLYFQDRSKEIKNIYMKQPTVVLSDIKNCRKPLNKCCKVYSNAKNGINFLSYLSHDKGERFSLFFRSEQYLNI